MNAILVDYSGLIVNRIVFGADYVPEAGMTLVVESGEPMAIGGTYIAGVYTPPPLPPPQPGIPPPAVPDANLRIDAGIAAAVTTVVASAAAVHAIPAGGALPVRFEALLVQMKVTMDAFVAMLQAQQNPP